MKQTKHWPFQIEINVQQDGSLPSSVQLCPISRNKELVYGRDQRAYLIQGKKVAEATNAVGTDVVLDCEHASYGMRSPAPAYGWLSNFRAQNGFITAELQYTDLGREALEKRHFRYLSPSFLMKNDVEVEAIHSVGLVNLPNLTEMKALNNETEQNTEECDMDKETLALVQEQMAKNARLEGEKAQLEANKAQLKAENEQLKQQIAQGKLEANKQAASALVVQAVANGSVQANEQDALIAVGINDLANLQSLLAARQGAQGAQQNSHLANQQSSGVAPGSSPAQLNAAQLEAARALGMGEQEYYHNYVAPPVAVGTDGGKS